MEHQQFAAVFHADLNPDSVFRRAEVIAAWIQKAKVLSCVP